MSLELEFDASASFVPFRQGSIGNVRQLISRARLIVTTGLNTTFTI